MRVAYTKPWPVVTGIALVIITAGLLVFWQQRAQDLVIVVPANFRGTLELRCLEPNGQTLSKRSGGYRLVFPLSGVLTIRGRNPYFDWSRFHAYFESGEEIPSASSFNPVSGEVVALRSLLTTDKLSVYVVGTASDYKNAADERFTIKSR